MEVNDGSICPICSVKVARDMLSHITLQHAHLFKLQRRRRLRRVAIPNSQALSLLGRDLREAHLQVLLGGGYRTSSTSTVTNAVTDPLLSSLIFNFPALEAEEICKSEVTHVEDSSSNPAPVHIWKSSFDPSLTLSSEEREKRMRQAAGRSGFVQDLFLSALLGDQ
ncbi:protein DEHYDRATION-INDUCED 19 [Arachis duranensis]|uniref:Protein DEHYDRATION-INDUCED 19 n=1 Tax=Arachis duranensis TaxID=130453 RepID=A0A9C6WNM3_ARADU|nr:protein DEHYDRATION-INDUCED 19 [Arachis duranensis]